MSEKNTKDDARVILKKITEFDVTNNYYVNEEKDQIAREFKKLLYVDDTSVRKFLEQMIYKIKELAVEFDLLATESEVDKEENQETPEEETQEKIETEEEEQSEEDSENPDETPEEVNDDKPPKLPESVNYKTIKEAFYSRVNDLLL